MVTLTERETEIAEFLCAGLVNSEIGAKLFISTRTVERHMLNITRKFRVRTRGQVVALYLSGKIKRLEERNRILEQRVKQRTLPVG